MRGIRAIAAAGVLLAAGIGVAGCGVKGTPANTGSPVSSSQAPSGDGQSGQGVAMNSTESATQVRAQLQARVPGQQAVVVAVPSGFEALTYDQRGHVTFWTDDTMGSAGSWHQDTTGTYPYFADGSQRSEQVTASGALLSGMRHVTFIVTGAFSEDGTGNTVAYTVGRSGWGVIAAQPSGALMPTSPKVDSQNDGVSYGLSFSGGKFQTEDCPANQPLAACGDNNTVKKLWSWNGTQFVRV